MVTQWFDPETGPASLPGTYAREMRAQGHSVRVLTGYPNYPTGKLYEGYRQRGRWTEVRDGIPVVRVPLVAEHSSSSLGRVANYASFAASSSVLGTGALRGADAIWVYNSPATVTAPLMLRSRFGGVPYFLHVMDLWPDSLIESGMLAGGAASKVAVAGIRRVVRMAERRASVIGVISPSVRDLILERDPSLNPDRIVFAPNPAEESLFRPMDQIRAELGVGPDPGSFTVMYAGAIGEVQGFDSLLDAAALLRDVPTIRFQIFGDGIARERLQTRVREERIDNVGFMGRVSQDEIPALMAQADAHLVSLAASDFLRFAMPSKIASLLSSGVPIVAQISGDGADVLKASGAAYTVDPGDVDGLSEAIERLARTSGQERERLGRVARTYYDENLSVSQVTRRIVQSLSV